MVIPRTLGLSKNRSNHKSKSRRTSTGTTALGGGTAGRADTCTRHTGGGLKEEVPLSGSGLPGEPLASCSSSADERPSSEPLGTGVRVYTCLFDAVGDIIQVGTRLLCLSDESFRGHGLGDQAGVDFGRVLKFVRRLL